MQQFIDLITPSRLPSWIANLFFFGLLITIVLTVFLWQLHLVDRSLQHNALERSRLVTGIIEANLRNAELASDTINEIIRGFLNEKAHFIDYLDSIEPLHAKELSALCNQTNLVGITLVRPSGKIISTPDKWLKRVPECKDSTGNIQYDKKRKISYLVHPTNNAAGYLTCVIIGIDAAKIITLRKKTSLPSLLQVLASLPGINYIRIATSGQKTTKSGPQVKLISSDGMVSAEARTPMAIGSLIVGLDAKRFIQRRNDLRRQFFFFGCLLTGVGLFFSWILYRYQRRDLEKTRNFERMIAKEHESASLGRATATIAHEVRNPLNAINMGLQRLQMETHTLKDEEHELIDAMLEAVTRTSTIVTELQRFTRDIHPKKRPLQSRTLIRRQIALYKHICSKQGIKVVADLRDEGWIEGDGELLSELVENLLKNSVEAQPDGGLITIRLHKDNNHIILSISNPGLTVSSKDIHRLGDPYFTTKIHGSGLGLALSRRIVEAHGGTIRIYPDTTSKQFSVQVVFSALNKKGGKKNEYSDR